METQEDIFGKLKELEKSGARAALVVVVSTEGHTPQVPGAKMIVNEDGTISGTVGGGQIEKAAIDRAVEMIQAKSTPSVESWHLLHDLAMCCGGRMTLYIEPIQVRPRLFIFGAGHVAAPTARLARESGFSVTVIDDRQDWNSPQRFPMADERVHVPYDDFLMSFEPSHDDYVLIVTQGHEHDERILTALIEKPLKYLGMIGSSRKVTRTLRRLPPESSWKSVLHAPVGLDIGAETPAEIAVAIAAELIKIRRGKVEDLTEDKSDSVEVVPGNNEETVS